jgi:hypothetical protein
MGMIAYFTALSPQRLEEFEDDPDEIETFLFPEDGEPPNTIDLDKLWHGVHYLLTGNAGAMDDEEDADDGDGAGPLAQAVLGGEPIGDDLGYGPARFLRPDEVAAVAAALTGIAPASLRERFDTDDMQAQQIYLADAFAEGGDEELGFLIDAFTVLQGFYRDAAGRGDAVLQWIA